MLDSYTCDEKQKLKDYEDAWFVDYKLSLPGPKWVRSPFMTGWQVVRLLDYLMEAKSLARFASNQQLGDIQDKRIPAEASWYDLRIQSEQSLDEVIDGVTKRERVFGGTYQAIADGVRSGDYKIPTGRRVWQDEPFEHDGWDQFAFEWV